MVIFLHGTDSFLVLRRKQALVLAFQKKYTGAEYFVFDFEDQGMVQDVRRALDTCEGGLFATEKIVVFLHPFVLSEPGEKLMVNFLKEQADTLPERTILLFVHVGKIKKTHPLTKAVMAKMDKEEVYDILEEKKRERFLLKELALFHEGVTIDPQALRLLLVITGDDTARQITELEKLATYKGEGVINTQDIEALLVAPTENNIFIALDALGRGDQKRALLLFRTEMEKGDGVYPVLSMCAWQVRRLITIREAYDQGIRRPSDIASTTKLPPFTVQKVMATIEHLSLVRLKKSLALLSDIDTALKQGKADPEASLDIFVWKF